MTHETPPQMSDVACLLLFAVEPSDRALAGWGIGTRAANALMEIANRSKGRKLAWRITPEQYAEVVDEALAQTVA